MPEPFVLAGVDEFWAERCRFCGCTDDFACPGGCWWVQPGLCSACVDLADDAVVEIDDDSLLHYLAAAPSIETVHTGGLL